MATCIKHTGRLNQQSWIGAADKRSRECFAVCLASYPVSAFATVRVNPGYPVNDQQRSHAITHCATALDYPSLVAGSSFLLTPVHR